MQTSQLSKLFSISLLLLVSSIPAFAVDKVIDGGAGDNNLIINYAGITSYRDFVTNQLSKGTKIGRFIKSSSPTKTESALPGIIYK